MDRSCARFEFIGACWRVGLCYWDGGGAIIDISTDSSPSASEHEIAATIAAGDVPDTAKRLSLALLPFTTHTTDPVRLFGVRIGVQMPK